MTARQFRDALCFFAAMVVGIVCICVGLIMDGSLP